MDLIKILSEGRKEGLKDEEMSRQVAETVLEELRQMSLEDFMECFTTAAFNRETNTYDIVLSFEPPEIKENPMEGKIAVPLSQKEVDCITQHLKTFRDQDLIEIEANRGKACETCSYNTSYDLQFYRYMVPLTKESNIDFTMMVSSAQIRKQYKSRREVRGMDNIQSVSTSDLIAGLEGREGVKVITVEPYQRAEITIAGIAGQEEVEGPAVILAVTD